MSRIAVFGGSFDPVHRGHLAVADAVQASLRPDLLIWMPARHAPHKPGREPAAAADRRALLLEVVAERPGEIVSSLEIDRPGHSYTVDTLDALARMHPGAEFHLVMGVDSLEHLHTWRDLPGIFQRAALVLVPRRGWDDESLAAFRRQLAPDQARAFRASILPMELVDVSSTEIRHKIQAGESCADLLPPEVEEQIRARGLYCKTS